MQPQDLQKALHSRPIGDEKGYRTELEEASLLRVAVTVRCDPQVAYEYWRDFANLPIFMTDVTKITLKSSTESHWEIDLPRGPKVEWDAQIVAERYGEMIAWKSLDNSRIHQAGTIQFKNAPANQGTIVSLSLSYELFGGEITELATKLMLEDPRTLILQNLRRFKAFMETGEIATIEGQSSGREQIYPNASTH